MRQKKAHFLFSELTVMDIFLLCFSYKVEKSGNKNPDEKLEIKQKYFKAIEKLRSE